MQLYDVVYASSLISEVLDPAFIHNALCVLLVFSGYLWHIRHLASLQVVHSSLNNRRKSGQTPFQLTHCSYRL